MVKIFLFLQLISVCMTNMATMGRYARSPMVKNYLSKVAERQKPLNVAKVSLILMVFKFVIGIGWFREQLTINWDELFLSKVIFLAQKKDPD